MKAIVTGASSGIGRDMAKILCDMGFTVYGVARREERLKEIKEKYDSFIPVEMDLSMEENIYKLYKNLENEDIDIEKAEKVYIFNWDRVYPADIFFEIDLKAEGFKKKSKEDFEGNSHKKITLEVFERV